MSRNRPSPPNYGAQPQGQSQPMQGMNMPFPIGKTWGGGQPGSLPRGGKNRPSPPSFQGQNMQWGGAPQGTAQQQMMTQGQPPPQPVQGQGVQWNPNGGVQWGGGQPGAMPPMTNQQGMPPGPQGGQPAMPPPGPPPGGPPPGGTDQFAAYRQMLLGKGGAPIAKDKYNRSRRNAQMSYAEKYGTDYDPRGSMAWMKNPSKKDRRAMSRINALRAIGPQGRVRQAVDPETGY